MAQYAFESVRDDYTAWWSQMTVTKVAEANAQAQAIIKDKARLKALEPRVKVPWFVVGCLLMREAGMTHDGRLHFDVWLHNGDPMHNSKGQPIRTVHKPANRPPNPNCTFEDGAYDALVVVEHLDLITDWGPERVAYAMEKFNGFGYRAPTRNIPSPYLVGGTSVQKRGKFTSDSHYDPDVMDPQIGGLAVLKQLMALDSDARFVVDTHAPPQEAPPIVVAKPDAPVAPPISPRADDTVGEVKPLDKSKTVWGGIVGYLTTIASTVAGLFPNLNNPYTLTAFLTLALLASVAFYFVIKGRIDVNNMVKHLSEDA
jgi:lysozyme family protein